MWLPCAVPNLHSCLWRPWPAININRQLRRDSLVLNTLFSYLAVRFLTIVCFIDGILTYILIRQRYFPYWPNKNIHLFHTDFCALSFFSKHTAPLEKLLYAYEAGAEGHWQMLHRDGLSCAARSWIDKVSWRLHEQLEGFPFQGRHPNCPLCSLPAISLSPKHADKSLFPDSL